MAGVTLASIELTSPVDVVVTVCFAELVFDVSLDVLLCASTTPGASAIANAAVAIHFNCIASSSHPCLTIEWLSRLPWRLSCEEVHNPRRSSALNYCNKSASCAAS